MIILLQEYVMGALSEKTVLLVTHQVEFLHAFDSVVVSIDSLFNYWHFERLHACFIAEIEARPGLSDAIM